MAFCEQHPAGLLPRDTLRQVASRARSNTGAGRYWKEYLELFRALNDGGGIGGSPTTHSTVDSSHRTDIMTALSFATRFSQSATRQERGGVRA